MGPVLDTLIKDSPDSAKAVLEEQQRLEEEDKERDLDALLRTSHRRQDTERHLQSSADETEDSDSSDEILSSPTLKENPFLYLGFGINLYFDLLLMLILTMCIICILMIPVYKIYQRRNNYEKDTWDVYTLGNFGYSSITCSSSSLLIDNYMAKCSTGQIASLEYLELLPSDSKDLSTCLPNRETEYCEPFLDKRKFTEYFEANCINKVSCRISQFKEQFVLSGNKKCSSVDTVAFFQYKCLQTENQLLVKREEALFVS